ncbi:MAG: response regulator [Candidatus Sericytochromatia bacterium]
MRILIIDDDEDDYVLTEALLKHLAPDLQLTWVPTFAAGRLCLTENNWDIAVVDYFLGQGTGLDLIQEARQEGLTKPMILHTGTTEPAFFEWARSQGADACICKDYRLDSPLLKVLRELEKE